MVRGCRKPDTTGAKASSYVRCCGVKSHRFPWQKVGDHWYIEYELSENQWNHSCIDFRTFPTVMYVQTVLFDHKNIGKGR